MRTKSKRKSLVYNEERRTYWQRCCNVLLIVIAFALVVTSIYYLIPDTNESICAECDFKTHKYSYTVSFDGNPTNYSPLSSQSVSRVAPIKRFFSPLIYPSQDEVIYTQYASHEPAYTCFVTSTLSNSNFTAGYSSATDTENTSIGTISLPSPELITKYNRISETDRTNHSTSIPQLFSKSKRNFELDITTNSKVLTSTIYEPFTTTSPSQFYAQSVGGIVGGMSNINTRKNAFPGMSDPGIRDTESPVGEPGILLIFAMISIISIYIKNKHNNINLSADPQEYNQ